MSQSTSTSTLYQAPAPRSFLLRAVCRFAGIAPGDSLPNSDRVVLSAQKCAALRALDFESENPIAPDPFARLFSGVQYEKMMKRRESLLARPRIPIRTRYFDNFISARLKALPNAQLVLLGAGMDSRVYRLDTLTPSNTVYELDAQVVLDLKEHLLSCARPVPVPRCEIHRIYADLSHSDWIVPLFNSGFDPTRPTIWVLEGLVYYLDENRVTMLLAEVRALSSPGSAVAFSAITKISEGRAGMFISAMSNPKGLMASCGFSEVTVDVLGGPNANYGHWPVATPRSQTRCTKTGNLASRATTFYCKASVIDWQ